MYAPKGPAIDYSDLNLVEEVLRLLQKKAKSHRAIWLKIDPDLPYATGIPGEDDTTVEPGNSVKMMLEKINGHSVRTRFNFVIRSQLI